MTCTNTDFCLFKNFVKPRMCHTATMQTNQKQLSHLLMYVRPIIKCGSWNPCTHTNIKKIQQIQHYAEWYIVGNHTHNGNGTSIFDHFKVAKVGKASQANPAHFDG